MGTCILLEPYIWRDTLSSRSYTQTDQTRQSASAAYHSRKVVVPFSTPMCPDKWNAQERRIGRRFRPLSLPAQFVLLGHRRQLSISICMFLLLLMAIVVRFAQRLPVGLSPEQCLIALVRNDVIDHRSRYRPALCLAHHAERVVA